MLGMYDRPTGHVADDKGDALHLIRDCTIATAVLDRHDVTGAAPSREGGDERVVEQREFANNAPPCTIWILTDVNAAGIAKSLFDLSVLRGSPSPHRGECSAGTESGHEEVQQETHT